MILSKASKRNIILFMTAFLLCGILNALLNQQDFVRCFSSLFLAVLTLLWAITVQKRILDKKLRSLMLWATAFLLFQFLLQIFRYDLFADNAAAQRYIWYAMYIPSTAQPIFFYYLAVSIHRSEDKPMPHAYYLFIVVGILLVMGVLTNDLHFWAKNFPSGILGGNDQVENGWLFYAINGFIYGLYVLAFAIIMKKNRRYVPEKYRWFAVVPLFVDVVYFILYPLNIGQLLFGGRIWNMGEMLAFSVIGTLEVCIQMGMIPSNSGYEALFSVAHLPAVILDSEGKLVYHTAGAQYPFNKSDNVKVVSHPISGGSIEYLVDMKQVQGLNQQLAERVQQIETRNAYISEENRIRKERAELETRNQLYERISGIVKPQLDQIDTILNTRDNITEKHLAKIAVLKAFIKRRSNMELLAAAGTLTVLELASAVSESLSYLQLCQVNTAVSSVGSCAYPADMVIAAYEHIEAILEESLDTLSDMVVTIRADQEEFTIRIMLQVDNFSYGPNAAWQDGASFSRTVAITKEDQDMIIVLTFTKGGGSI